MTAALLPRAVVVSRRHPDVSRDSSSLMTADAAADLREVVKPRN